MIGKSRNFGLDVVRAISIILVLIAHRFNFSYEFGIVGVQIFFVLSGFLIGQILIKDFKDEGKIATILKFWKRRWYRTLPLYYLILILKIAIYGNPYGWKIIVYFLFLQANFVGIDFFGVSWSLVVEEWFYIFLPLATFLFFKNGIQPKKYILLLVSFVLFFLVSRFLWNFYRQGVIIYQFDCLLLGVLMALLKIYWNSFYKKLNSVYLFSFTMIGVIIFTIILGKINSKSLYDVFYRVFWYTILSVFVSLSIPFIEQSSVLNTQLKKVRPLFLFFTWTSILTYSMYLIHMEIFQINLFVVEWLNLFAQIFVLYLLSFILYVFYEHPMMSLRDNFSLKQYTASIKAYSFYK